MTERGVVPQQIAVWASVGAGQHTDTNSGTGCLAGAHSRIRHMGVPNQIAVAHAGIWCGVRILAVACAGDGSGRLEFLAELGFRYSDQNLVLV